jgi:predicted homoserine dehydrogenase-like protein
MSQMGYTEGGGVWIVGVDMGGRGDIVAETSTHIVIKWAAGEHWAGIGEYAYHSPSIVVYEKENEGDVLPCGVKRIIEWDVTRRFIPLEPKKIFN